MHTAVFRRLGGLIGLAWFSMPVAAASLHATFAQVGSAQQASYNARQDAYAEQSLASRAWTPEPPTLALAHGADQGQSSLGRREWEAEFAVPLWLPGQRRHAISVAEAEARAGDSRLALARWQLAGELREAWWEARLAAQEQSLAQAKLTTAEQLASDVQRRVQAGDLAPLASNQAQTAVQEARRSLLQASALQRQTVLAFNAIAGDQPLPDEDEASLADEATLPAQHPQLLNLAAEAAQAEARWLQQRSSRGAPPELTFAVGREREQADSPYRSKIRLGVKVAFGQDDRLRSQASAAHADWLEASANLARLQQRLQAQLAMAQNELTHSRQALPLVREQLQLAHDRSRWIEKAFRLGQLDLAARWQAENEQFSAQKALARAQLEVSRAISRLNQAAGVLP